MDARKIKRAMAELKMDRRQLAAFVGVTESAVSLWLSGKRNPSVAAETLIGLALAQARGEDVGQALGIERGEG